MAQHKRAILVVLDSAGIGSLPDAADFGDAGANTICNICRERGHLDVPNMYAMGLSQIQGVHSLPAYGGEVQGAYGRAMEKTHAKDTTCGHWEMAGVIMEEPFQTYPNGFPPRIMEAFEAKIGRGTLGNCVASGTAIIQELGDEHVRTGKPIVYTSADSVFQVAAHEAVIPLEALYAAVHHDYRVHRPVYVPELGNGHHGDHAELRRQRLCPEPAARPHSLLRGVQNPGVPALCRHAGRAQLQRPSLPQGAEQIENHEINSDLHPTPS